MACGAYSCHAGLSVSEVGEGREKERRNTVTVDTMCRICAELLSPCESCDLLVCAPCAMLLTSHWAGVDRHHPHMCIPCTRNVECNAALTFLLIAKYRGLANNKLLPVDIAHLIARLVNPF